MDTVDNLVLQITKCAYKISTQYNETLYEVPKPTFDELSKEDRSMWCGLTSHILGSPYIQARSYHDAWYQAKLDHGWKYGEEENLVLKEHPFMLPYDALPATAKIEMTLYITSVLASHVMVLNLI